MKISVIIAAYNAEKYLVETLQSVVNRHWMTMKSLQ